MNQAQRIPFNGFKNFKVSLRIVGTSPVTTCTCERSFSAMSQLIPEVLRFQKD